MNIPEHDMVCNWGPHKGKRLCYEYCAHSDNLTAIESCTFCAHVRKLDEITVYILRLIRNNLKRPLGFDVLIEHLCGPETGWSESELRSAIFRACEDRVLRLDQTWRVTER